MYQALIWDQNAFHAFDRLCRLAGNNETGVLLVGHRCVADLLSGMARVLYVVAVIGPGPAARASTVSFTPDRAYQSRVLTGVLLANPHLALLGEGHRHPSFLPTPSGHDIAVAADMARDPDLALEDSTLPIVIATCDRRFGTRTRCFLVRSSSSGPQVSEIAVLIAGSETPITTSALSAPYHYGATHV